MQIEVDYPLARGLLPKRPPDAHKGTFGHVFIVAGSRGFTGAAKLACDAAARSGVGLVTAGVPRPLADIVASALVEPMSLLLPATEAESLALEALGPALKFAEGKNAVVLGPGLSQHPATCEFALEFIRQCPVPMLVDADGLNALSRDLSALRGTPSERVLTPHPGEMSRLSGIATKDIQADREGVAARFANEHHCVVALKGHRTVIADPDGSVYVNSTGNDGLATGGTGDVLAGLIGGLMAQGLCVRDAAILGVYVHGCAGDLAAIKKTARGMVASDVLAEIPEVWRRLEKE